MKTIKTNPNALAVVAYDRKSWLLLVKYNAHSHTFGYRVHPRIYTALRKAESLDDFLLEKVAHRYQAVVAI